MFAFSLVVQSSFSKQKNVSEAFVYVTRNSEIITRYRMIELFKDKQNELLTSYTGRELNHVTNFKLKTPSHEKKIMVHMLHFLCTVKLFDYLIY